MNTISELDIKTWRSFRTLGESIPSLLTQEITKKVGISAPEFRVLMELNFLKKNGSPSDQKSLLINLNWEKSRLSHLLNRMESKGLVERSIKEGKLQSVNMSNKGFDALNDALPVRDEYLKRYFCNLLSEEDKQNLLQICEKLETSLDTILQN